MVGAEDHHAGEGVFQLPDVAGILVVGQELPGLVLDGIDADIVFLLGLVQEELDQIHQVLLPFPERGDPDADGADPVVKALVDIVADDLLGKVPGGRGDQPAVDLIGIQGTDGLEGLALNGGKKSELCGDIRVQDLLQEEGAVPHGAELAGPDVLRAGERVELVAEELVLKPFPGIGLTVYGYKGR